MGNLSGESREQSRKDKVTRFRSVTYARQLGLLVNTLGSHLNHVNKVEARYKVLRLHVKFREVLFSRLRATFICLTLTLRVDFQCRVIFTRVRA